MPVFRSSAGAVLVLALTTLFIAHAWAQLVPPAAPSPETETAWTCPMHPDYTMDIMGRCPRCGMDLVRAAAFDVRDYGLDFRTIPAVVRPGQKATFRFKVSHPGTGAVVTQF